jgi:hypothetical protein
MDEWTGKGDEKQINEIYALLNSTLSGILKELNDLKKRNETSDDKTK